MNCSRSLPRRSHRGDWKGMLAEMVDRRARLFERAMPFKDAADVHRHRSLFLRKDYPANETRRAGRARGRVAGGAQTRPEIFRGSRSGAQLRGLAASAQRSADGRRRKPARRSNLQCARCSPRSTKV